MLLNVALIVHFSSLYAVATSSGYFNGFKRSIHDGGFRTAFIARWPGVVAPNTTTDQQVVFYDFLPTVQELTGAPHKGPKVDGTSFLQTLKTGAVKQPEFIYHDFDGCQDPVCTQTKGLSCDFGQNIRMGDWSGVCVGKERPCTGKAPGRMGLLLLR